MSGRIPVLFFSNSEERGGAEEHILTLLRRLSHDLFEFQFVCPPAVARAMERDVPKDVQMVELTLSSPKHVSAALRLRRLLRERKIAILHSHMFYSSFFASPVGRAAGVPVILETPHVREQWRKGWKANYAIDRLAGRFVDQYIAVSDANSRYLVDEKGLPSSKVTVIRNGSDLSRFEPTHTPPIGMREELGFKSGDPVVIVPARLAPQKGHSVLLQAIPFVLRDIPNTRFVCLGDGELRGPLQLEAAQLGIEESILWPGCQSNMPDWFALADLVVLPSFFEGLPLCLIEALACGKTAVATAVDGTPEVLIDGVTGLLVPPGTPAQLAESIVRMLRDHELRGRLAANGRQWVLEEFSDKKQVAATEELYLRLYKEKAPEHAIAATNEHQKLGRAVSTRSR